MKDYVGIILPLHINFAHFLYLLSERSPVKFAGQSIDWGLRTHNMGNGDVFPMVGVYFDQDANVERFAYAMLFSVSGLYRAHHLIEDDADHEAAMPYTLLFTSDRGVCLLGKGDAPDVCARKDYSYVEMDGHGLPLLDSKITGWFNRIFRNQYVMNKKIIQYARIAGSIASYNVRVAMEVERD